MAIIAVDAGVPERIGRLDEPVMPSLAASLAAICCVR
jgi:hypothetical protein